MLHRQGNFKQEKEFDQPTQKEELVPKRGATSVTWMWFRYEKSDWDWSQQQAETQIQFNLLFIYKSPNYNKSCLMTFFTYSRSRPETQQYPHHYPPHYLFTTHKRSMSSRRN